MASSLRCGVRTACMQTLCFRRAAAGSEFITVRCYFWVGMKSAQVSFKVAYNEKLKCLEAVPPAQRQ